METRAVVQQWVLMGIMLVYIGRENAIIIIIDIQNANPLKKCSVRFVARQSSSNHIAFFRSPKKTQYD